MYYFFKILLKKNSKTLAVDEVLLVQHNSTLLTDEIICDKDIFDGAEWREGSTDQVLRGREESKCTQQELQRKQSEIFNEEDVEQEEPKEASQLLIAAVINMN